MALDEIKSLMGKMNTPNSTLASTLCILYYKSQAGSTDKTGSHSMSIKLNLLGALPAEDEAQFAEYFGSETTAGLYSRFVVALGPNSWNWDFRWRAEPELRVPSKVYTPDIAHDMSMAWQEEGKAQGKRRGHLAELAKPQIVNRLSALSDDAVQ